MTTSEEADETEFWLELLVGARSISTEDARPLLQEASELTAIFVTSAKTARGNRPR